MSCKDWKKREKKLMIMMINLEKLSESSGKLLEFSDVCGFKYNVVFVLFLFDLLWFS